MNDDQDDSISHKTELIKSFIEECFRSTQGVDAFVSSNF